MKKNNLFYLLATLCIVATSCNNNNNQETSSTIDDSSTTVESSSVDSSSETSTIESSSTDTSSKQSNYEPIMDVNKLFETYESNEDYNFIAKYRVDAIQARQYANGWETNYQFDGANIQLDYKDDAGVYYSDFLIYDEEKEEFIYYLDMQGGNYRYLDSTNDYYANYVNYVDYFELAGIDFEKDMLVDEANHKLVPVDAKATARVGQTIFGNNANEYWHNIEITYEDGYIVGVTGVSIYREVTYYYDVKVQDHGYVNIKAPKNATEYKNPYQPYMKHADANTTGIALSDKQKEALSIFSNETSMNYTLKSTWTYVNNNMVYDEYKYEFNLLCEYGNYHYSYVDSSYGLTYNYFLLSLGEGKYPVIFEDDNFDGIYNSIIYDGTSTNNYSSYVSSVYIDRVLFYGMDPNDFFYNEEEGYIFAKTTALEDKYVGNLFYFSDSFGGLRIYLKDDGNNGLILDKIETSMYVSSDNSIASYIKTYEFSNINTTTIEYPEGVSIVI